MRSAKSGKGFTLIELLVVVAVIALLIAIILPSLSIARQQAKSTQCLAKLQQLGRAAATYNADWGVLCYEYYWNQALLTYIGGADPNNASQGKKEYYKMFICPSPMIPIAGNNDKATLYAGNNNIFNKGDGVPFASPPVPAARIDNLKRQSDIIVFGDANQAFSSGSCWWVFDWSKSNMTGKWGIPSASLKPDSIMPGAPGNVDYDFATSTQPGTTGLRYRHGSRVSATTGTANVIYLDWHAEGLPINTQQARSALVMEFQ